MSIYGLKQVSRTWFERFNKAVVTHGFQQVVADSSLFVSRMDDDVVIILLYVDDIIITGSSEGHIAHVKAMLNREFNMKDFGLLKYFLGMEIDRRKTSIRLTQSKYALDLLQKANMLDCTPVSTPMTTNKDIYLSGGDALKNPTEFRMLAGGLQYLTLTRPDITFAVNQICQFVHNPTSCHLEALKRILRYVKGTVQEGTSLYATSGARSSHLGVHDVIAYSDADWAGDPNTRRLVTGCCVYLGGSLVAWKCRKQKTVARSSMEVEYRALASTVTEVV